MMTDPIADLLTRLRNSVTAKQLECKIPVSKLKGSILEILKQQGYIVDFATQDDGAFKQFVVQHKYIGKNQRPVLNTLRRVSKPGCRIYSDYRSLRPVLGGVGLTILSTPKGIMTDHEARQQKVGGEVLCEIW